MRSQNMTLHLHITTGACLHLTQKLTSFVLINLHVRHVVKLREREGQGVDPGRSLKGHLWMVDGGYPFPDALH